MTQFEIYLTKKKNYQDLNFFKFYIVARITKDMLTKSIEIQ